MLIMIIFIIFIRLLLLAALVLASLYIIEYNFIGKNKLKNAEIIIYTVIVLLFWLLGQ